VTTALTNTVLAWLLTYAIHSTVLLGLAWLIARRAPTAPAVRDFAWKVALVGGIVTATAQTQLGVRPAGSVAIAGSGVAAAAPQAPRDNDTTTAIERDDRVGVVADFNDVKRRAHELTDVTILDTAVASVGVSTTTPATSGLSGGTIAVAAWAAIALLLSMFWLARRLILLGRLGDRRVVTEGSLPDILTSLRQSVRHTGRIRLTSSSTISSPVALGVGEICVPDAALTDLDAEQQRGLLAHELAHLARRDPLWLDAASLLERVFFFQPLNRVARREFQQVAEYLCDDWAAARTGSGVPLAKCLARVAEWIQASPLGVPVAGMAEQRSLLVTRIARLIEGKAPASPVPKFAFGGVAVVMLTAMVAAAPGVQDGTLPPPAPLRPARAPKLAGPTQPPMTGPGPVIAGLRLGRTPRADRLVGVLTEDRARLPEDTGVVDALVERLKDSDAGVRRAAAQSLGNLHSRRAVTALIAVLDDRDREVRSAAANALGNIEDSRAVGPLQLLIKDPSADVREQALGALSNLAHEDMPTGPIVNALRDSKAAVRERAAQLLGRIGDHSAVGPLTAALHDLSADVRSQAIDALREIKDPTAASAITGALKDDHPNVRRSALGALREMRVPISEKVMIDALDDPNAEVRSEAVQLAGERPSLALVPVLKQMLSDPSSDVRVEVVSALGEIGDPTAREGLRTALKSKDARVRQRAAEVLGDRR
jgi:HEAT repeat protein/beta-lactamase regulating signal transducer with metallopeptidase domain